MYVYEITLKILKLLWKDWIIGFGFDCIDGISDQMGVICNVNINNVWM